MKLGLKKYEEKRILFLISSTGLIPGNIWQYFAIPGNTWIPLPILLECLPILNNTYQYHTILTNSKQYLQDPNNTFKIQTIPDNTYKTWYQFVLLVIIKASSIITNMIPVSSCYHYDTVLTYFCQSGIITLLILDFWRFSQNYSSLRNKLIK
jgi:hypothetical protein